MTLRFFRRRRVRNQVALARIYTFREVSVADEAQRFLAIHDRKRAA